MSEVVPFTKAKAKLSELVDRVAREHQRVYVTKNGEPAAVIMSPDDLESLEETLDILSDSETITGLRESIEQAARGEVTPLDDALNDLGF